MFQHTDDNLGLVNRSLYIMNITNLENEILSSVENLNGSQKNEVLDYIKTIKEQVHSSKRYRRQAMKEIREALLSA